MMKKAVLLILGILAFAGARAEPMQWDASRYSQEVTRCDRLASHGDDPDAVAHGVSQGDMDFAAATWACEAAVAADPGNPRLRYQLARVYAYSGNADKAIEHWPVALAAEYPQALFVRGYMLVPGGGDGTKDACAAEKLLRRSAEYGRLAAQTGYARYALDGAFDGCSRTVDPVELRGFLDAAAESTSDYYRSMLIAMLREESLDAWPELHSK